MVIITMLKDFRCTFCLIFIKIITIYYDKYLFDENTVFSRVIKNMFMKLAKYLGHVPAQIVTQMLSM